MKGQAILSIIYVLPVIVISLLVTYWIYGNVSDIVPHDKLYYNEQLCSTCANHTNYEFDNYEIINDTTLVCVNGTERDTMTNGVVQPVCGGYSIVELRYLNISNSSVDDCTIEDVRCTYTHNNANDNEDSFHSTATTNINSGFTLSSVAPIIMAAVVIIVAVFLLGRSG